MRDENLEHATRAQPRAPTRPAPIPPAVSGVKEHDPVAIDRAAELFKALSTAARVSILLQLRHPASVSQLVDATGLSQPLVSQHLRVLRGAALVTVTRRGRGAVYALADTHIHHVLEDALAHTSEEPHPASL